MRTQLVLLLTVCVGFSTGCNAEDPASRSPAGPGIPENERPSEPGNPINVAPSAADRAEFDSLSAAVKLAEASSAADLLRDHHVETEPLSYSPGQAQYLDLIQGSSLALNDAELATLEQNGFVIAPRHGFPTFGYGYVTLYMHDLPVFVSADSLLFALHRSYDEILKSIEQAVLIGELGSLLEELRAALSSSSAPATTRADLDFYLTVALRLLQDSSAAPVAGASAADVAAFVNAAVAASGTDRVSLFGVDRDVDFSQFVPRGHYTDSEELTRYFRAMMWLGRIDFRLIETQGDGSQVFHRRQYDAMLAMSALFGERQLERFRTIDTVVEAFVGESDYMTLPEVTSLVNDLGGSAQAASADDEVAAQTILDGGYGAQRIASHLIVKDPAAEGTLPLNRSFLVFGQRYILDSHVFSNVVYDRTQARRMMPDPLDVAFAALGNDAAAPLLQAQLEHYEYAGNLLAVRTLADAHGEEYWNENLYNSWLGTLRGLSPGADPPDGLPAVARTEPWGRRVLNTQLASWAELRHDTILYAKQSYTAGASCEFPDGYVDPYPAFYAALARYAERGESVAALLPETGATHWSGTESVPLERAIAEYYGRLRTISETLLEMAELQRDGLPFEQKHLDFLNRAVKWYPEQVCGAPPRLEGWYSELFFSTNTAGEYDPTIADVHTQPTDEGGAPVGQVLHVGTGNAELLVVTIDTCAGPKAYAGLASSYYEHITSDFDRLNDERWKEVLSGSPPKPAWMQGVLSP